ncbi:hypothetical protein lerEdw1_010574 [Lerista edwardsae]|nr:hypothetical protein lerEdw1_010574 [Lerista edwardsae]
MSWCAQRCQALSRALSAAPRPGSFAVVLLAASLSLLMYPALRTAGSQMYSAVTGSYVSGTLSVALISCPDEQTARDVARAIMEKKLAVCVAILPKASTMYTWKGEIEEATEIVLPQEDRLFYSLCIGQHSSIASHSHNIGDFSIPRVLALGNILEFKRLPLSYPLTATRGQTSPLADGKEKGNGEVCPLVAVSGYDKVQLVKTRTSKISQLSDYVRSIHPFEIPEFISMLIDQGNPAYLRWIGENIPDDA